MSYFSKHWKLHPVPLMQVSIWPLKTWFWEVLHQRWMSACSRRFFSFLNIFKRAFVHCVRFKKWHLSVQTCLFFIAFSYGSLSFHACARRTNTVADKSPNYWGLSYSKKNSVVVLICWFSACLLFWIVSLQPFLCVCVYIWIPVMTPSCHGTSLTVYSK